MPGKKSRKEVLNVRAANMTLGDSILKPEQIEHISKPTNPDFVYERKGRGNKTFKYVKGHYIKIKLNELFGFMWDFKIVSKDIVEDQIIVHGQLTVHFSSKVSIVKEQFGGAEAKFKTEYIFNPQTNKKEKVTTDQFVDLADDYKAAATDALKKCANEWGICNDIYADDEYSEVRVRPEEDVEGEVVENAFDLPEKFANEIEGSKTVEELLKICNQAAKDFPDYETRIMQAYTALRKKLL